MVSENNHPPVRQPPQLSVVRPPTEEMTAWVRVMNRLRELVGPGAFASWCKDIKLMYVAQNRAVLSVPNLFLCHWLEQHHMAALVESCRVIIPSLEGVELRTRSEESHPPRTPVIRPPVTHDGSLPYQRRRGRARQVPSIIGMSKSRIELMVGKTPFLTNGKACTQDVQLLICSAYGLPSEGVLLGLKPGRASFPKSLAVYLSMVMTRDSTSKIGEIFGGMSVGEVKYHHRKIHKRVVAGTLDAKTQDIITYVHACLKEAYANSTTKKGGP